MLVPAAQTQFTAFITRNLAKRVEPAGSKVQVPNAKPLLELRLLQVVQENPDRFRSGFQVPGKHGVHTELEAQLPVLQPRNSFQINKAGKDSAHPERQAYHSISAAGITVSRLNQLPRQNHDYNLLQVL
jgi:hypothetical protein